MTRNPALYLEDIFESITLIEKYIGSVTKKEFKKNIQLQDSVIRRLEIIGEAVKHIPADQKKKYPAIPWKQIAGMRDIICHEYFGVNIDRVWIVLEADLAALKAIINKIKKELQKDEKGKKIN